ncbi:MAG: protein TolR [Acidobacteria bacterium]|nr:protein TolR [Acidobacteriota bacterium]
MPKIQDAGADTTGSRSRRGRRRVATSLSEINVIPLVDVMLVLLIIFMVAAPMMQQGFDVALPEARRADPIAAERLFVTIPATFEIDRIVQVGDEQVRVEMLEERMRSELIDAAERDVFVRSDGDIRVRELVTVMDRLKAGGVANMGLVTEFPSDR